MSYLSPYLEALGSDFSNGANFAMSGSTTMPRDRPFALHVQVQQFLHFKQRSLDLITHGSYLHFSSSNSRVQASWVVCV
jgi:hypothetical protein